MKDESQNQNNSPENAATTSSSSSSTAEKPRKARGFAAMDPTLVSELAKRGGKAAHRAGTAHQFTSDEARIAGRKGGMATHAKRDKHETGTPH
jgi:general stress protein YciG